MLRFIAFAFIVSSIKTTAATPRSSSFSVQEQALFGSSFSVNYVLGSRNFYGPESDISKKQEDEAVLLKASELKKPAFVSLKADK